MSVQTRLILATLCVFNGVLLLGLGVVAAVFVDGPMRVVAAAAFWIGSGSLFVLSRRLREGTEWR